MKSFQEIFRCRNARCHPTPVIAIVLLAVVIIIFLSAGMARAATRTVTSLADSGAGSLRQTISDAAAGDTILFGVSGKIALTSGELVLGKDLTILGPGASVLIISGNRVGRVFRVNTNVNVTLSQVTIADGAAAQGAGIHNSGGTLILHYCTLAWNFSIGPSAPTYSSNPGTNGYGGAVYTSGILNAINCTFLSNSVTGGDGGTAAWPSAAGGAGADGNGGAIGNFGTLLMTGCLLANNTAKGGSGGAGMAGFYGCPGEPGGAGGNGGFGNGGALFNSGPAHLVNNTFALNAAVGGHGGSGGSGGPPMSQSCPTGNGGHGGVGGSGYSAIYDASGECYLTNCTLASNMATQGVGGVGGPAGPWPYPYPPRIGSPGANGADGAPGSALISTGIHLLNTLISGNAPLNCAGPVADEGRNLSSDASCLLGGPGSATNVNPKLGPLADNGGPTFTFPLLTFSPAIDAGALVGAPAIDQRGIARPQGRAADIGAYEYQFTEPQIVSARCQSSLNFWLQSCGRPHERYAIQTSTDLFTWTDATNLVANSNGVFEFTDCSLTNATPRFYRLKWLPQAFR